MFSSAYVPAPFGHWLLDGGRLVCRMPRRTVTVRAPKKLLLDVMAYCDGSRSWANVLAMLRVDWEHAAVDAFMQGLVRDGVIVDAALLWAHWGELAQLPASTAVATTAKEISTLHRTAEKRLLSGQGKWHEGIQSGRSRLARMLVKRESARTFDDKPVSVECLCSILWAAHGVTRPGVSGNVAWHRTVASGGNMHSARWFVAVLRDLAEDGMPSRALSAGIYEAQFHKLGGVSLRKRKGKALDVWRCLTDPRVLRFASALILPVYDVAVPAKKYGNRASLFAMVEAGQALQNAQLMSVELGASGMLRGDTIAQATLDMLGLQNDPSHWFVVPAMVLGAQATQVQVKQQQMENVLKITPNLQLLSHSFAFASRPAPPETHRLFAASGRSDDPQLALRKAEAEGWERLAWVSLANHDVACFSDMPGAMDPRELVAYSARQYAQKSFPCVPFSLRRKYLWAKAMDTGSGRTRSVIADCLYGHAALPPRFQKTAFTSASTSGMAAGTSQQEALCRATLELIERDAFVCAWISRRAPKTVRRSSLPQAAGQRITALSLAGFRIVVSDVSTDWVPVVSVFAQSDQLPLTAITAAAHFSAEQALEKALDEIEGRIAHAQHFLSSSSGDADPMQQIERYYRHRQTYKHSDFYVEANDTVALRTVGRTACRNWEQLQSRIFRDGFNLLAVNMTPEGAAIEQGRVPLHVVRAIVPGLVPIWFQKGLQPEGLPRFTESVGGVMGKRTSGFFIHPFT